MNHFEAHLMVSSKEVDSKVLRMAIKLTFFVRKRQNGECDIRNFRRCFFCMSSDVLAFKVPHFYKWLWISNWSKWILVVDIPTQILLTILLFIDHSSWCKLKVYKIIHTKEKPCTTNLYFSQKLVRQWNSREWVKFVLECILQIFIYSNSKFKVTYKNADFECHYIRTHTKQKPSKISNIKFSILPFYQKKILKLNGHPEYFGIYYSWWNH